MEATDVQLKLAEDEVFSQQHHVFGFTLIEMMLVLVIVSTIIVMGLQYAQQKTLSMQIDRTVIQMQYIMNAGLAYYVANGQWPGIANKVSSTCSGVSGCADPLTPNFSPPRPIVNVLGSIANNKTTYYNYGYTNASYTNPNTALFNGAISVPSGVFQVYGMIGTSSKQQAIGAVIASKLGGIFNSGTGNVLSYVNIPGQNLNNATAINFAGLYHHGGCVPVPVCPANLLPQVFIAPVSVSGVWDQLDDSTVYPIDSFNAFATAPAKNPPGCSYGSATLCTSYLQGSAPVSGQYWRVCLDVITTKGNVAANRSLQSNDVWGKDVTLAAFTRCAVSGEPAGSTLSLYSN